MFCAVLIKSRMTHDEALGVRFLLGHIAGTCMEQPLSLTPDVPNIQWRETLTVPVVTLPDIGSSSQVTFVGVSSFIGRQREW